jgi:hypothetical protein
MWHSEKEAGLNLAAVHRILTLVMLRTSSSICTWGAVKPFPNASLKPIGYSWSYLALRIGYRPLVGSHA